MKNTKQPDPRRQNGLFRGSLVTLITMSTLSKPSRKSAFTLIELLTVIAIIGILAAILIPAIGAVREQANSSKSVANLRQIGNAVSMYTNVNNGKFPLLNRKTPGADEKYYWTQAIEEVIFQWDRSESGNHPIFQDPTLEEHHTNSDYGGNISFFGNGADNSPGAANSYMSIFKLARPATSVFVCTAHNPSNAKKQGSPLVSGSYANSGSGNGVPHARLSGNQVGLVFADGHVELVDGERLDSDDDYRKRLFDPSAL